MIKKCKICQREFEAYNRPNSGGGMNSKARRRSDAVTCGHKCSQTNTININKQKKYLYRYKNVKKEI